MSDSLGLLKPSAAVTYIGLQTKICNLEAENESLKQELRSASRQIESQDKELLQLHERNGDLDLEVQNLKEALATVTSDRDEIKNSTPIANTAQLPEPADLLNQLKAKRKKSKAELADIEAILDVLERLAVP